MKPKYTKQTIKKNVIHQRLLYDEVYYILVEKQSQTGLFLNQRMLFLTCKNYQCFYSKQIPKEPYGEDNHLPSSKLVINIEDIKVNDDLKDVQTKTLKLDLLIRETKNYKENWKFVFETVQLKKKWIGCFCNLLQKKFSKALQNQSKSTITKQTFSRSASYFSFYDKSLSSISSSKLQTMDNYYEYQQQQGQKAEQKTIVKKENKYIQQQTQQKKEHQKRM